MDNSEVCLAQGCNKSSMINFSYCKKHTIISNCVDCKQKTRFPYDYVGRFECFSCHHSTGQIENSFDTQLVENETLDTETNFGIDYVKEKNITVSDISQYIKKDEAYYSSLSLFIPVLFMMTLFILSPFYSFSVLISISFVFAGFIFVLIVRKNPPDLKKFINPTSNEKLSPDLKKFINPTSNEKLSPDFKKFINPTSNGRSPKMNFLTTLSYGYENFKFLFLLFFIPIILFITAFINIDEHEIIASILGVTAIVIFILGVLGSVSKIISDAVSYSIFVNNQNLSKSLSSEEE